MVFGLVIQHVEATQASVDGERPLPQQSLYAELNRADLGEDDNTLYAEVNFKSDVINEVDAKGETLLTLYASLGALKVVRSYIKAGANVNFTNPNGYTALMLAVERGHYLTSVELVHAYTDLSIRSVSGMTAFLVAIAGNHVDIAVSIADAGGNIHDYLPHSGVTGLMMAAQKGNLECVEFLIARGVDVNAVSTTQETALLFAVIAVNQHTHAVIASLLLAGANINHANKNGLTPLMLATSRKQEGVVKQLLDAGADARAVNGFGQNAMDIAFENNDQAIMGLLNQRGLKRSSRKRKL